jgi:5-methylcytosine-specific restriction endonuclease McrA
MRGINVKVKINPLDKVFSEYVRKLSKGYCAKCGGYRGWQRLQCSHFVGRARKSTRWDEENVVALCFYCHQHFTAYPYEHVKWFTKRIGEDRLDALIARSRIPTKIDKEELLTHYKNKLQELDDESLGC